MSPARGVTGSLKMSLGWGAVLRSSEWSWAGWIRSVGKAAWQRQERKWDHLSRRPQERLDRASAASCGAGAAKPMSWTCRTWSWGPWRGDDLVSSPCHSWNQGTLRGRSEPWGPPAGASRPWLPLTSLHPLAPLPIPAHLLGPKRRYAARVAGLFAPGLLTSALPLVPWPWFSFKESAVDAERRPAMLSAGMFARGCRRYVSLWG